MLMIMNRRLNQALAISALLLSLFLIFIFLTTLSSSSPPHHDQSDRNLQKPRIDRTNPQAPRYQMIYIKNTKPFVLNDQELAIGAKKRRARARRSRKRKSNNGSINRPFSVMLPKGQVPPSGSSPCHNDKPDSVSVYCDLSATEP